MKLVCPACGTTASAEVWQKDVHARQCMPLLLKLPGLVQPYVLEYLALFRKDANAIPWRRVLRLLGGLVDLVNAGRVTWERSEERPAPPELWAQALDAVLARSPKGLTNHNYLRHTAFEMAAGLAAKEERRLEHEKTRREYNGPVIRDQDPISEEERAEVAKTLRDFAAKMGG